MASAQKWQDRDRELRHDSAMDQQVEVADVDGDGKIDLLLANGGSSSPGQVEPTRVFRNTWGSSPSCTEILGVLAAGLTGLSRMIGKGPLTSTMPATWIC